MDRNTAAVFIMLGQSNATGHALPMRKEDVIGTPLAHVFGLRRDPNQSFDTDRLVWSGWTSADTNLGETQDNTYSVPNCLAAAWESAVDAGADLPDLYIVHISIGAQGVTSRYMWHPDYKRVLVPGPLGIADVALTPLTVHVLSLLKDSFDRMGKQMRVIGLHWRGGEEDIELPVEALEPVLTGVYEAILPAFRSAVGTDCPIILHRVVCFERADDLDPTGEFRRSTYYVDRVFDDLAARLPDCTVFDPRSAPFYDPAPPIHGIFEDDHVHFTERLNKWVAEIILRDAAAGVRFPSRETFREP